MDDANELTLQGGCLCGALRYHIKGQPFDADYCHCRQCQQSSGAAFMAWMDFKVTQVEWMTAKPREYSSSTQVRRGFCEQCGCSISYRHTEHPQYITLSIATLDNPNWVSPKYHIYCDNQPDWLHLADNCQRYNRARS
ncbi:GFA family protein [Shewanella gaetbuli]|uniref:GFA family protein n=1 Tax=Shewanella gaetbuli TaxID=220752 RepID=A0A9X1ZXE9_9GAMM|nr:GFA family protein [Shewanella gaetbuli]MCL1144036.1 GFA family protein [Shewanella gaetbuli]